MAEHLDDPVASPDDISEDEKLLAILAYVPFLCLIPFTRTQRSEFVTGHVRLGMTLFVIEIFALILRYLRVIWDLILVLCIIGALAGIFHVVRGRRFFLPYLSELLSRRS
jgi:glycopeptide antibiotics resistance protein